VLGADRLRVAYGGQIELAVPFDEFPFIGMKGSDLPPRNMNIEQCQRILDEFFHDRKLYMLAQYNVNEKT
jgi:hypothetical protein